MGTESNCAWIARMLRESKEQAALFTNARTVEDVGRAQIAVPPGYVMNSYEMDGSFLVTFDKEPK